MQNFFRIFLNIHDFFDFFVVFQTKLFCTVSYSYMLCIKRFPIKFHIGLYISDRSAVQCKKMLKFFRSFLNIHDFFDFFEVFRIKFFCTVSYSHVLTMIRFPVKFYIGLELSGHGGRRGKNNFISKTVQKCAFTRVKIA